MVTSFSAVQLTDLHLRADPAAEMNGHPIDTCVDAVIARVLESCPDPRLVFLTGDLADDPNPTRYDEIYARLQDKLRRRFTVATRFLAVPGNHDRKESLKESFEKVGVLIQGSHIEENWRFVLIDTSVPDSTVGFISGEQIRTIDELLEENPNQPMVLLLHHPPVRIRCAWLDSMRVSNAKQLFDLLERNHNCRAMIWGHVHQAYDELYRGIRQLGSPAACPNQFKPEQPEFALDGNQTPGARCFHFHSNGQLDSWLVRL